jgi:hypothetical protein
MKLHLTGTANRRTAEFRRVVSFDIRHSLFDIFPVSCSIKVAAPAASG